MSSNPNTVIAFDLYGTLLSTASISTALTSHFGPENAHSIAALWRRYQLEYTWRLNSMNQYQPFATVTLHALQQALAEHSLHPPPSTLTALLHAYDALSTFPDVSQTLQKLSKIPNLTAAIFSNGDKAMVSNSVTRSADLAPHASLFKHLVTVEPVRRFKPHADVYLHLAATLGKTATTPRELATVWLVSGNPFDVVGARAVGMNAIWVDREDKGWTDALVDADLGPTAIVRDLSEVVDLVVGSGRDDDA